MKKIRGCAMLAEGQTAGEARAGKPEILPDDLAAKVTGNAGAADRAAYNRGMKPGILPGTGGIQRYSGGFIEFPVACLTS